MLAVAFGLPFPFRSLHLLWLNFVTDGSPAVALVMDPADEDVLKRVPRRPPESVLGKPEWISNILVGLSTQRVVLEGSDRGVSSEGHG